MNVGSASARCLNNSVRLYEPDLSEWKTPPWVWERSIVARAVYEEY